MYKIFTGSPKVRRSEPYASVAHVAPAGDGVFSTHQNGQIQLVDLKTNTTTPLVSFTDIRDVNGRFLR